VNSFAKGLAKSIATELVGECTYEKIKFVPYELRTDTQQPIGLSLYYR